MTVKPLNAVDLRNILTTTQDTVDALSDPTWVKEMKEAELLLVIKRGTPNIRMQVARQTNGVQILHFLIADHIETAEAIAENQTTPQDVLDTLAQTRRIRVMLAVAKSLSE
jgi:hypothetical protein